MPLTRALRTLTAACTSSSFIELILRQPLLAIDHHMMPVVAAPAAATAGQSVNPPAAQQDQQWTAEQRHFMQLALEQVRAFLQLHCEVHRCGTACPTE